MAEKIVFRREADGCISCSGDGLGELRGRLAEEPGERRLALLASTLIQGTVQHLGELEVERARLTADEIPVLTACAGGPARRPLVLFVHGYTGCKESDFSRAVSLAEAGFFTVVLDARLHGERKPPDFDERFRSNFPGTFFHVVHDTARDISALIEHFSSDIRVDPRHVGVAGISMGGFIAFTSAIMDKRVKAAAPLIGSPHWDLSGQAHEDEPGQAPSEETLQLMADWEPLSHPERFWPAALLMQNGADDGIVPIAGARNLYEKLVPLYAAAPERLRMIEYPGVGHEVTPGMFRECAEWFGRFLRE